MDTATVIKQPETVGEILDKLPATRNAPAAPLVAGNPHANLLQLAIEQGRDLATLERLMDLQERWEVNQARKAFVAAMAAFKADPPTIVKNKKANYGQGKAAYEFAGLDQIAAVIGAALAKHGLSASWRTEQLEGGRVRVTCSLRHELGHSEETSLEAGADTTGSKNPIQAVGSTITYLSKYTLLALTGLAASDQDDDGAAGGVDMGLAITDDQKRILVDMMREAGADVPRFLAVLKVGSIDALPAKDFQRAKDLLQQKINATKQKAAE